MYTNEIFERLIDKNTGALAEDVSAGKNGKVEMLYRSLKSDLLCAVFKPGERLIEDRLTEKYGLSSRTPVREVLARLKSEGHVGVRGRSFISPEYTAGSLLQLYDVRLALEELAVQGAMAATNTSELSHCLDIMSSAYKQKDTIAINASDSLFHLKIAEMSGNEVLYDMLSHIHEKVFRIRNLFFKTETRVDDVIGVHNRILDSIDRGVKEVAVAEMSHHLTESRQKFKERMI